VPGLHDPLRGLFQVLRGRPHKVATPCRFESAPIRFLAMDDIGVLARIAALVVEENEAVAESALRKLRKRVRESRVSGGAISELFQKMATGSEKPSRELVRANGELRKALTLMQARFAELTVEVTRANERAEAQAKAAKIAQSQLAEARKEIASRVSRAGFWVSGMSFAAVCALLGFAVGSSSSRSVATADAAYPPQSIMQTAQASTYHPAGDAFQQGFAARREWEQWFATLTGDAQSGAAFWAGQRSLPHPTSCALSAEAKSWEWVNACEEAARRLAPSDARRRMEAGFRRGWNSYSG
jgi:hypothetical protein